MSLTVMQGLALASLASWAWLLLFRGGFWRADQRLATSYQAPKTWPAVAVVVPARDEAETIADAVRSLTAQDYPGALGVFVVDDNSTDATADIVQSVAHDRVPVHLVDGKPLPRHWTGKMWAVAQGV